MTAVVALLRSAVARSEVEEAEDGTGAISTADVVGGGVTLVSFDRRVASRLAA